MKSYKRTGELSMSYKADHIDPSDPRIKDAVESYKTRWGLPETAEPAAETWFGIFDGEDLLVVAGEKHRESDLEVTDLYVLPGAGRRATVAIYALLNVYATSLRRGLYKRMIATVLFRNDGFQRAVERVFSVKPTAMIYMAEAK